MGTLALLGGEGKGLLGPRLPLAGVPTLPSLPDPSQGIGGQVYLSAASRPVSRMTGVLVSCEGPETNAPERSVFP